MNIRWNGTGALAPPGRRSAPAERAAGGLGRRGRVEAISRARSGMVAAICVVMLVLSASGSSAAVGSAAGSGPTPIPSAGLVAHQLGSADVAQEALDYWTPERMESAQPIALAWADNGLGVAPAQGATGPSVRPANGEPSPPGAGRTAKAREAKKAKKDEELEHRTGVLQTRQVTRHPHGSVGKVFLTLNGFDFVCSASAVSSAGRWGAGSGQLVATAGHCVSSGNGQFVSRFIFVPGYADGLEPFGRWPATQVLTTNPWHNGGGRGYAYDVAFARVSGAGEHVGAKLHDVVDALDIAFTQSYPEDGLHLRVEYERRTKFSMFGYGVEHWGGESQVSTTSRVDLLDPNFSPSPVGAPSGHTGGSSGGPWLYNYARGDGHSRNVLTGVNSYVYRGVDRMYSPQFTDAIHALWAHAAA